MSHYPNMRFPNKTRRVMQTLPKSANIFWAGRMMSRRADLTLPQEEITIGE